MIGHKQQTIKVELLDTELAIIRMIAATRTMTARSSNVKDAKMTSTSGLDIDFDGLMAEYAYCKHYNLFLGIDPAPRSGSYDCKHGQYRIDIKSTRYKNGRLVTTLKHNPDVDIYILAIIEGNTVEFVGYVKSEDLYQEENKKDLGRGIGYCLEQEQLLKLKQ